MNGIRECGYVESTSVLLDITLGVMRFLLSIHLMVRTGSESAYLPSPPVCLYLSGNPSGGWNGIRQCVYAKSTCVFVPNLQVIHLVVGTGLNSVYLPSPPVCLYLD